MNASSPKIAKTPIIPGFVMTVSDVQTALDARGFETKNSISSTNAALKKDTKKKFQNTILGTTKLHKA